MDIFSILTFIGGLALFLYGMDVMGKGLEKHSGGRFKSVLERLTSNPIKGVLLGAGVTALIQSSSATTVMVVGFVNSGVMQLSQAISIIMGANVGTTITAWLISLTGIQGDNLLLQMMKPSSFSPVLAAIGIVLSMFSKSTKKQDIGGIMLGFAVLMFGMETMSNAVQPLANVPEFTSILTLFSNPIIGILTGALVTGIIQSSSAAVGILQALSATGSITYASAVPIIMGQNIGTCVTAMISSIGTNKNAKRAAVAHLYFNIIGTTVFLVVYYSLNAILKFPFINDSINAMGIAAVHTIFNLFATIIFLPFTKQLEKLACITFKSSETSIEEEFRLLDDRLLASPSVAVSQCYATTCQMAEIARDTLFNAMSLTKVYSSTRAEEVKTGEDLVDLYEDRIGTYLVKLSNKDLSVNDSRQTFKMLHCIGDFERVSDHAVNIMKVSKEINDKEISFSKEAADDLNVMHSAVKEIINIAFDAFLKDDVGLAKRVEPLEQVVNKLKSKLKARHIERLRKGGCTTEIGFIFSDLITNYERIADHCSNIALCLIQVQQDNFDTHEYIKELKSSDDEVFAAEYKEFYEKYSLSKNI
ncbi:MAG: Na/Pi cotransporter family protein [Acutalibacteraceae bacterium]|nr:Na/Pi cotransporter family protein [Clostridiales bacterium]